MYAISEDKIVFCLGLAWLAIAYYKIFDPTYESCDSNNPIHTRHFNSAGEPGEVTLLYNCSVKTKDFSAETALLLTFTLLTLLRKTQLIDKAKTYFFQPAPIVPIVPIAPIHAPVITRPQQFQFLDLLRLPRPQ